MATGLAPAAPAPGGLEAKCHGSLSGLIDKSTLECLNESNDHPVGCLFDGCTTTYLQSDPDVDDQLLISVGFRAPVKISHVRVSVPPGAEEEEAVPRKLKIFVGRDDSIDFGEAETRTATGEFDVVPGADTAIKFVKFQGVSFLRIFVEGSNGGVTTKMSGIDFIGIPENALEMKDWKKPTG